MDSNQIIYDSVYVIQEFERQTVQSQGRKVLQTRQNASASQLRQQTKFVKTKLSLFSLSFKS